MTAIGENAFGYCNGLTSVSIPNTVKIIEAQAFRVCNSLTSIDISDLAALIDALLHVWKSNKTLAVVALL